MQEKSHNLKKKIDVQCMNAAAQSAINPDRDPDEVLREFFSHVFGDEYQIFGDLFESFEVVKGLGYYPRRNWSRQQAHSAYLQVIECLEAVDKSKCKLPLLPSPEQYRKDLLWFSGIFDELSSVSPDRDKIKKKYWDKALGIYDYIPMSADQRAHEAA